MGGPWFLGCLCL